MCITLLNPPGNSMTQIGTISVTVCKLRLSKFPEVTQFVSGGADSYPGISESRAHVFNHYAELSP